ncbi:MAG: hypothetical protein AAGA69_00970 [Pseudomonadota bacterium]
MALTSLLATAVLTATATAPFTTDQAAKCAAVHAFTLDAMRVATNVPAPIRRRVRDGLAMWEYELSASAPKMSAEKLQAIADAAVTKVHEDLPQGNSPEAAAARGDYLTKASGACANMIATAYGDAEHPVVPYLREADAKQGVPQPLPVSGPLPVASSLDSDQRGLR